MRNERVVEETGGALRGGPGDAEGLRELDLELEVYGLAGGEGSTEDP